MLGGGGDGGGRGGDGGAGGCGGADGCTKFVNFSVMVSISLTTRMKGIVTPTPIAPATTNAMPWLASKPPDIRFHTLPVRTRVVFCHIGF